MVGTLKHKQFSWVIEYFAGQDLLTSVKNKTFENEMVEVYLDSESESANKDWLDALLVNEIEPIVSFELIDNMNNTCYPKLAVLTLSKDDLFDKTDLNYQLGMYVGEYIILKYLPTLSTDMLQSRYVIDVTLEEGKEYKRLETEWFSKYDNKKSGSSEIEFKVLRDFTDSLAVKYLKNKINALVPKVYPTNMEIFGKGIKDSIWDCEFSWYDLADEFFSQGKTDGGWYSTIVLELKLSNYQLKNK